MYSDKNSLIYQFVSFAIPNNLYRLNLETFEQTLIYETPLKNGSPEDFVTDQIWFNSKDGTSIPAFVIRK
jgi:prolyl oligopeptidase